MSNAVILLIIGVIYFAAHAFAEVFQRTRVPDVLILMIIGIFLGPVFGVVTPESFGGAGDVLTTVALAVILFEGALSLKLEALAQAALSTLVISLLTMAITFGMGVGFAISLLQLPLEMSLLVGAIVAGTSSAVVIPMTQALKMNEKVSTILLLESAITDVICIVLAVALITSIQQQQFAVQDVAGQIGVSLSLAAVIGLVGGLIWLKLWPLVRKFPSTTFTTIAYGFLLYGLTEIMGYSGAISVLVYGLTISNVPNLITKIELPKMTETERGFFQEVVFLLKTFFFIYLGLSIKFSNLYVAGVALAFVLTVYFLRVLITRYSLPVATSPRDATLTAFLIPKGLAAAVLASMPLQLGFIGGETIQLFVYSVILFSILVTAVSIPLVDSPILSPVAHGFFRRYKGVDESIKSTAVQTTDNSLSPSETGDS